MRTTTAALTLAALALSVSAKPTPRALFVAVGHHGARLVSEDGRQWTHLQTGKEGEIYRALSYGNGRFVAVGSYGGNNIFATTEDGVAWKTGTKEAKYVNYLRGLGFGDGHFIALGGDPGSVGSSRPFVVFSPDGVTWPEPLLIAGKNMLRRLAHGNGRFVAVGDRGRRAASADARTWQDAPEVKAIDTLVDVAFGNGVFAGVGLHGLRMASTDGLKWTDRQLGEEGEHLNTIVWAEGRFVAVGLGATFTSADGRTWQRHENKNAPLAMAYGNGVFVGTNWKGRLLRSADAVTWEQVHQCEHHLEAIAFGNGR